MGSKDKKYRFLLRPLGLRVSSASRENNPFARLEKPGNSFSRAFFTLGILLSTLRRVGCGNKVGLQPLVARATYYDETLTLTLAG